MKPLISALLLCTLTLNAQTYDCSQMNSQLTHTTGIPFKCGLPPGPYQAVWDFIITVTNTTTHAVTSQASVEASGQGWCGGAYINCGSPTEVFQTSRSGANWVGRYKITGTLPGGYPPIAMGNGCAGTATTYSSSTSLPALQCPCTSGVCGTHGCPACAIVCPTRNLQCTSGSFIDLAVRQQNLCWYPNNYGCPNQYYITRTYNGQPCCVTDMTPIIFNLDKNGASLTSAEDGVPVDWMGNGRKLRMAWTKPGSTDAWLVKDPGFGPITGAKMFGNQTPQPLSDDPNGFLALAQYDLNKDGVIDLNDPVFNLLYLWTDTNHDGIVDPGELHTLDGMGVLGIELAYTLSKREDRNGNRYRYLGTAIFRKGADKEKVKAIADVIPTWELIPNQ